MTTAPPDQLYGVPVDLDFRLVDRSGAAHRTLCAGPYLRCLEHTGKVETTNVAQALATNRQHRADDLVDRQFKAPAPSTVERDVPSLAEHIKAGWEAGANGGGTYLSILRSRK